VRLQKYLAECGVSSRRGAEELMIKGRVTVNDKAADKPGIKVSERDIVKVDGKIVKPVAKKIYLLLNKPVGYVTTVKDDHNRQTVIDLIKDEVNARVFPVGRLDLQSEGLLLMTNDGEAAFALTHPKHDIAKKYIAVLNDAPTKAALDKLRQGVVIDGKKTKGAKVRRLPNNTLEISITEGRNRQIRKMIETVGLEVTALKRVSIGMLNLGNIPLGRWRHLTKAELQYLKGMVKNDNGK